MPEGIRILRMLTREDDPGPSIQTHHHGAVISGSRPAAHDCDARRSTGLYMTTEWHSPTRTDVYEIGPSIHSSDFGSSRSDNNPSSSSASRRSHTHIMLNNLELTSPYAHDAALNDAYEQGARAAISAAETGYFQAGRETCEWLRKD